VCPGIRKTFVVFVFRNTIVTQVLRHTTTAMRDTRLRRNNFVSSVLWNTTAMRGTWSSSDDDCVIRKHRLTFVTRVLRKPIATQVIRHTIATPVLGCGSSRRRRSQKTSIRNRTGMRDTRVSWNTIVTPVLWNTTSLRDTWGSSDHACDSEPSGKDCDSSS
jgi:hypothetical protein